MVPVFLRERGRAILVRQVHPVLHRKRREPPAHILPFALAREPQPRPPLFPPICSRARAPAASATLAPSPTPRANTATRTSDSRWFAHRGFPAPESPEAPRRTAHRRSE